MSDTGTTGLVVLVVCVLLATAFGLWRRRTDGRMRSVPAATVGRPSTGDGDGAGDGAGVGGGASAEAQAFPLVELGITPGTTATLVQFSTAFCQPCRATRRTLTEVAAMVDGVVAVDVDAEAHLDVVRAWGVMRTPTVFVLDAAGTVVSRASGQPRKADVIAAIGAVAVDDAAPSGGSGSDPASAEPSDT